MDQHTPPHVCAPAPVDGVAAMPDPPAREYRARGYNPSEFPVLCSNLLDDRVLDHLFGHEHRGLIPEYTVYIELVYLIDRALSTVDDPEKSHQNLHAAWAFVDRWLHEHTLRNSPSRPVAHLYRFLALELQHAMRVLPDPEKTHMITSPDVIRDLVNPVVAHGTFNGVQVALRAGEDWDQAIEKQSPLPERHRAHIIRVTGAKDWNDVFARKHMQCNCQPAQPAEPKPVNVISADQVKPKRIRGVANVYRALFDQARSSSQARTTTIVASDIQTALSDPKFVEVHPVQLASQYEIVPDLSS